ncbi:MAG TPA: GNAT family N-acetyltransferase [Candidatus Paceibacterota bacterium]|nr:GNAT family N-acetyltransferase [Candidatus Paceibacterota bacterium]
MDATMEKVRKAGTSVQTKSSETGRIELRVRRLTGEDLLSAASAERILKVITQLIENEEVLDFTVLSDPDTWVMGIFEGVVVEGEFEDPFLIGMATANFKHSWTGWKIIVDDVIVFDKNRHKGIGRALMEAMEELGALHEPPCKTVVLTSDRNDAFAFYYRIGYTTRGEQQFKKRLKG